MKHLLQIREIEFTQIKKLFKKHNLKFNKKEFNFNKDKLKANMRKSIEVSFNDGENDDKFEHFLSS